MTETSIIEGGNRADPQLGKHTTISWLLQGLPSNGQLRKPP